MRVGWPVLSLLLLAGCGARAPAVPRATTRPVRVMSVNLCTDQLVLALLPPARIASVSWLAREPALSVMAAAAARVALNRGEAEEVIAQAPDLVVADGFGKPVLRAMLKRLGYPLVEVDEPTDVAGIRRATRQVAAAVGERARGEALIAAMDADLFAAARSPGPSVRVAAWGRDGVGGGPGSLEDVAFRTAGARNAGPAALAAGRTPDIEALLRADPALLVEAAGGDAPSLGDAVLRHPVVRRRWRGRVLAVPAAPFGCGTPMFGAALLRLRAKLRTMGSAGA